MKQKLLNLKSWLLMCLMMVGVNAWAAPGDEIKSPNDVVSGKSYYIKGVSTVSKKETTFYFTAADYAAGKIGESSTPTTTTDLDSATPVTFTKSGDKWALTTPSGLYIRPHSSNGQMYLVEDALSYELVSCDTKEGANKGMKIGPFVNGSDNWYIQVPTSAQKIGGYKTAQYGVTLIEAEETSGKTETSLSFGEGSPYTVNIGESFTAPTLTATPSSILSSVTYSSSNTAVAEVNSTTGAVTIKGLGTTKIKAKYEGDDDYLASSAEYVINVVDPNAITATFDLSANQYGWSSTSDGDVYFDGSTYTPATEGDVTLSVSGNVRMWGSTTSSLRLYKDGVGSAPNIYSYGVGAINLKAAEGYVITSVTFEGSNLTFKPSNGTYTNPTWAGEANEITFEKGENTPQIKTITVNYKKVPTFESLDALIAADYKESTVVNVTINNVIQTVLPSGNSYLVWLYNGDNIVTIWAPANSELDWMSNGTVKGTLKNVQWLPGNKQINGDANTWSSLEYTAPTPDYTGKSLTLVAKGEMPMETDLGAGAYPGYFATFSSDKDVFIPMYDDTYEFMTNVYTVYVEDGELVLEPAGSVYVDEDEETKLPGYYVPKFHGVLLFVTPEEEVNDITIPYYEIENVKMPSLPYNMLRAAVTPKETDSSYKFYKLAYKDQSMDPASLGFYYGAADGAAFDSREGSAYLAVPAETAANVKGFSFVADDATAIKNVENKVQTNAVYNLAGQRVSSKNYKGIVIKNGKQILNK